MKQDDNVRLWGQTQVAEYTRLYPVYVQYAETLQKVLQLVATKYAPESIIQTRPKSIASFAEKIWRKKQESSDPVHQFTDLCGGRVITTNQEEIHRIGQFIEKYFRIDWENSVDVSQRLKPSEFGYRSVHYIVQFQRDADSISNYGVPIPDELFGLKAEIQVRTLLEHVWADFSHKMIYKKGYRVPKTWERELAKHAALLEEADTLLLQIQRGLGVYIRSYGSHLTREQMQNELEILNNVLEYNPTNTELITQMGRLAINMGEWEKAVEILSPHASTHHPVLLRDLGIALCHLNRQYPEGAEYRKGLSYLEEALNGTQTDAFTLATLADGWAVFDQEKAHTFYQQAFEADPSNAYPLSYYLATQIRLKSDLSLVSMMRPVIEKALIRSRELANVEVDLPWAFYDLGFLNLMLGDPDRSANAYAKALDVTPDDWMAQKASGLVEILDLLNDEIEGYDAIQLLLLLGLAVKFPSRQRNEKIADHSSGSALKGPVVIVAGETLDEDSSFTERYRPLIKDAFREYSGTVISGGTMQGICGLVGELQELYPERIETVGYTPERGEADGLIDSRYSCVIRSGHAFSLEQPLQYWIDLINSGIAPSSVRLLGISGGKISASEYRVALALGAVVGILEGSGREAVKLLIDEDWKNAKNLIPLPQDAMTIQAFIGTGTTGPATMYREKIAQSIHQEYLDNQITILRKTQPSTRDWTELDENLKESNRLQADHIEQKLKTIGCSIWKKRKQDIELVVFTDKEVEIMAEMEHGRYNAERLLDGWRWGTEKNMEKKTNPYLVPWAELPDSVKEWDRDSVRKIPQFLADIGFEVYRID